MRAVPLLALAIAFATTACRYHRFDGDCGDRDDDGLEDCWAEDVCGTDPQNPDSDDDGVLDGDEDNDGDGVNNDDEIDQGTDPNDPNGGEGEGEGEGEIPDSDGDGRNDDEEAERGTDANDPDTDGDGDTDGEEHDCGSSPLDPYLTCPIVDSDDDGFSDEDEAARGTDPNNADTDGDGDTDGAEVDCGSSPVDPYFTCANPPNPTEGDGCP